MAATKTLKILTWNCNLNFTSKYVEVEKYDADVLIIQECEKLEKKSFKGYEFHWIGHNEAKGLAILTKGESEFLEMRYNPKLIYFLPVKFKDILILGVWAFNSRAKKFGNSRSGYFLDAIEHYKEAIGSSRRVIIAGDFNNGPQWDIPGHQNNFVDINRSLNDLGLFSAYHVYSKEVFGLESMQTHFHQKNPEKKFHIDYIYANFEEVVSAKIERFENWSLFSDHTPLFTELK